ESKIQSFRISYFDSVNSPLNIEMVKLETVSDPILSKVKMSLMYGWDAGNKLEVCLEPYFKKRKSLSVEDGCVFYCSRVVIPQKLQIEVLRLLHENHVGIVRMKMITRSYAWWPKVDDDIQTFCNKCLVCQQYQWVPKEIVKTKWSQTTYAFERVHVDFFH